MSIDNDELSSNLMTERTMGDELTGDRSLVDLLIKLHRDQTELIALIKSAGFAKNLFKNGLANILK